MSELLFDKAKVAFVQGKFEEAVQVFGEMIAKDPDNPLAYYSRGVARFSLRDLAGAIEDYTASIRLYSRNEKVHCSRGAALLAQDRTEDALKDFNQAIELNPFYPTAYLGRAEAFKRLGEHDQARMDLEVATKIQQKRGQSQLESQGLMFQTPDP